jgi:hypothetical protein
MEVRSSRRMRTLVTRMARRGLSVNEVARALISMMVRSKTAPTSVLSLTFESQLVANMIHSRHGK